MYVEEKNRSWCSSSNANDQRAITIECASDTNAPYTMNTKVYDTLVKLCIDICKRNGKKKLVWLGNKDKTLNYSPKSDEMVITVHRWFANKSCPGDWLYSRLGDLAKKVTSGLGSTDSTPTLTTPSKKAYYRVRKSWNDVKSQKGAYTVLANAKACANKNAGYFVFNDTGKAVYPVAKPATFKPYLVEVKITNLIIRKGPGTSYASTNKYTGKGTFTIIDEKNGWGKLKSGIGWISLAYATKV